MKYTLIVLTIALFILGCSKKDDVTNPQTDNLITGNWKSSAWTSQGENYDSLIVDLNLTGKDGTFTGDGQIVYGGRQNFSTYKYTIKDDASGSYSQNEVSVTVISSISGNLYHFRGSREDAGNTIRYVGTVSMLINQSDTVTFTDIHLIKSN